MNKPAIPEFTIHDVRRAFLAGTGKRKFAQMPSASQENYRQFVKELRDEKAKKAA